MKKTGKTALARKIMLKNPNLSSDQVLAKMKKAGFQTTKVARTHVGNRPKKDGKKRPDLRKLATGKGSIRLGTKKAAIMKELYADQRASGWEIKERLAEKGVNASISVIWVIRSEMRRLFKEIDFSEKPKPIRLSKRQQEMIPEFTRIINWALFKKILPGLNWPIEGKREFGEFVNERLLQLVKNYEEARPGSKTNYVVQKLRFFVKDYVKLSLKKRTGLTKRETLLLIRIIREKAQGGKDSVKIAKELGCPKREVDELWKAYQLLRRIQGRTGKKGE